VQEDLSMTQGVDPFSRGVQASRGAINRPRNGLRFMDAQRSKIGRARVVAILQEVRRKKLEALREMTLFHLPQRLPAERLQRIGRKGRAGMSAMEDHMDDGGAVDAPLGADVRLHFPSGLELRILPVSASLLIHTSIYIPASIRDAWDVAHPSLDQSHEGREFKDRTSPDQDVRALENVRTWMNAVEVKWERAFPSSESAHEAVELAHAIASIRRNLSAMERERPQVHVDMSRRQSIRIRSAGFCLQVDRTPGEDPMSMGATASLIVPLPDGGERAVVVRVVLESQVGFMHGRMRALIDALPQGEVRAAVSRGRLLRLAYAVEADIGRRVSRLLPLLRGRFQSGLGTPEEA
jgi:hypothetical protein